MLEEELALEAEKKKQVGRDFSIEISFFATKGERV